MHVWGKFIYECSPGVFGKPLPMHAPCGELFDRLLGVLAAKPPYIHASDSPRYVRLIREFRELKFQELVPDLPLDRLPRALHEWVASSLETDPGSLAPSLALDTGRFIEAHAYGRTFRPEEDGTWEILPLVSGFDRKRHAQATLMPML